ncbi:MAG: type II toxin-antitoxin system HigB family toxin [Puniceicoccaceae bacterium]|nr:MAG: type II toxin-antitoxin system HigB family toxin [Puniceicoccaceae bacterium]
MHIISRKPLREFSDKHPQAKVPLDTWFAEVSRAQWTGFSDVRAAYRSADVVAGNRVIFNIGGNKYRLIVKVAYKCSKVYVRFIGTHAEYDKIDAKTI